ncbi:MAG: zinc-binding dehydrogenase [Rhizobiaceae bacterium]
MTQPQQMKALLLNGEGYTRQPSGTALEALAPYVTAGTIEVPRPNPGQALIKVALASVNPSDVMFIKGMYGQPRVKGRPAGFEGVGKVIAVGDDGASSLVGRRVAFATGVSNWGSWAEYAIADTRSCIPLVDGVSDENGAALIVNPLTALAMFDIVRETGDKAFVLSAAASQLCKLMMGVARDEGFRPIAIVRRNDQAEILRAAGATHVLNSEAADFDERLAEVMRSEKPRIFLDAVAGPLSAKIFDRMPNRARWIIYGKLDAAVMPVLQPGQMIFMRKRIEGFWLTAWMQNAEPGRRMQAIGEVQNRFSGGRWNTDVTAIVPMSEAVERLADEANEPNGKVFIKPGE